MVEMVVGVTFLVEVVALLVVVMEEMMGVLSVVEVPMVVEGQ